MRLLEHKPEFAAGYDWLAQQYISTGRLPDAERILKSRLEKNPHDPSAVLTLASFYRTQKRDKDADGTIQAMMARPKDFPDPYTVAGDFYVTGRNWQQAEHYFQAGLAARPSAKSAYLTKLAAVSLAQNRIPDALKSLNDAIKAKPDDWDAQSLRIETLIASKDKKQLDEAIAAAQGLIKRQPRNPRLPYLLANAYLAKGDEKSAVAAYQQAAAIGKQVLAPRLALARISKEKRDAAGMLRYSGEVLAVNPREPDARLIHADGLAAQGNFAEADREMSALVKDSPESAEVRSDAALLFLREKRTRMAIEAFQALLAARPDDQRALAGLTTAYMQQGSWDEAIRVVDNEVKRDPTSAPKRLLLSAVALRLRRPELALQQYQALAQAHPESADYQFELGQLYAAMGEKKKAIAGYEAAVRLGTPDANRLGVLAIAYHAAGMEQEADAAYSGALKLRPSDPILLNDRAYFLAESGKNPDEAIQLAKTALQHLPDNPALMDTLALSYIAKDMIPDATAILNPLVRAHPDEPMFRYHLAMALLRSGGRDEARKQLQISLRKRPARDDEGRIKELLARLG
ncbi:MAG: tetratricopeptide repeat protein [Bryobacteraceae bacterium]